MRSQTHVEAEGATTEDAIADALRRLGVSRAEVDIKVIDEGKKGFLGLGSRPARVFVSIKKKKPARPEDREESEPRREESDPHKSAEYAKEVLSTILGKMGFDASLTSSVRDGQITLSVDCSDREGLLIGRRGETLQSLEHVVARMTSRQMRERASVVVDVSGYRERRTDTLQATARELADEAIRYGREVQTEPLVASDRRTVHRTLNGVKGVETEAIGEGAQKRIAIRPTGEVAASESRPDGPRERGDRERRDRGDRGDRRGGRGRDRDRDRDRGRRRRGRRDGEGEGEARGERREREPRPERRDEGRSYRNGDDARRERRPEPAEASEPLDLLGNRGGEPPKPAETSEGEERKVGMRSRRRRPAKKRL